MNPSPKLTRRLNADERVLWYGRPRKTPFLMQALESASLGITVVAILVLLVNVYLASYLDDIFGFIIVGCVFAGVFLFIAPYLMFRNAKETEYMVTNERVFFDALGQNIFTGSLMSSQTVDLKDVQEVYIKKGFHDWIFKTSTLYIYCAGFQRTTRYRGGEGPTTTVHKPPSFSFIKEAKEVQRIIHEAAEGAKRNTETSQNLAH